MEILASAAIQYFTKQDKLERYEIGGNVVLRAQCMWSWWEEDNQDVVQGNPTQVPALYGGPHYEDIRMAFLRVANLMASPKCSPAIVWTGVRHQSWIALRQ